MRVAFAICAAFLIAPNGYCQEPGKIYKECLKAADYKGCVQVLTQGATQVPAQPSAIDRLRASLKVLPSRVENTSLQNFTTNTQDFTDSLALVEASSLKKEADLELYNGALRIQKMLDALQAAWSTRIYEGTGYASGSKYSSGSTFYHCHRLKPGIEAFNYAAGRTVVVYNGRPAKGLFGGSLAIDDCSPQEYEMVRVINSDIAKLLVDPAVVAAEKEKDRKEAELAKMAAWDRHLASNPDLKAWAKANPGAAKSARAKWEAENAKKETESNPFTNLKGTTNYWQK